MNKRTSRSKVNFKEAFVAILSLKGPVPEPAEVDSIARQVFEAVASEGEAGFVVRRSHLYNFLVLQTKAAVSKSTVDRLFTDMDADKDGYVDLAEFTKALHKVVRTLARVKELEREEIPDNYVVPGSSRMNSILNSDLFKLQVVSQASMKTIYDIFKEFDLSGSGTVTLPEFKKYMQKHKPDIANMAVSIFNSIDKKKKGSIDFRQMLQVLYPDASPDDIRKLVKMAKPKKAPPKITIDQTMLDEIKRVFQIYDDDNSGYLDKEEFLHAVQQGGFTEEEAATCFYEIDTDDSGHVSYDEFEAWYIADLVSKATEIEPTADLDDVKIPD